jgi:hypothetical protein
MQRLFTTAVLSGAIGVACSVQAADLPTRASLARLTAIGRIVVTVAGAAADEEPAVRQGIERRLETAGITVDPSLDTELVADVTVTRDSGPRGQRHATNVVALSLREPVRTERVPRSTFRATTWATSARLMCFAADIPAEMVLSTIDNQMSEFLGTISRDTAAAESAGR